MKLGHVILGLAVILVTLGVLSNTLEDGWGTRMLKNGQNKTTTH